MQPAMGSRLPTYVPNPLALPRMEQRKEGPAPGEEAMSVAFAAPPDGTTVGWRRLSNAKGRVPAATLRPVSRPHSSVPVSDGKQKPR